MLVEAPPRLRAVDSVCRRWVGRDEVPEIGRLGHLRRLSGLREGHAGRRADPGAERNERYCRHRCGG
jgi:hypothetical protein